MKSLYELFEKAGFTGGEAKILEAISIKKQLKAGEIIKITALQSSTVYHVLDGLKNEGLLSVTIKNNIKYYNAVSLDEIMDYIDKKVKSLESIKINLKNLKDSFSQSEKEVSLTKIYEGYNGFLSAYKEAISSLKKEDTIFVFVLSKYSGDVERVKLVKDMMRRLREEKNIKLNAIISETDKFSVGKDHEKAYKTEVKYIKSEFIYPAVTHIVGDYVLIGISSSQPSGILIKDAVASKSYRNLFFDLWKIAKK